MSEVVFIGTSDAFGAGGRRQSAILLRAPGGNVLMDCGPTTGTGMSDLGISRDEIDTILISHFHGDHIGGIPALLLGAFYEDSRKHPLRIAGPPGIEARVRELAAALCYDLKDRQWSFPILFEELIPGKKTEIGPVTVHSFKTFHQPHTCPHGLVVDVGDHHDWHQRRRHARLRQRGHPGQLVRGDAKQHHVGFVWLRQGQGACETRGVDGIEGHRRRRVQQVADRPGAGRVVADEQHPDA